MSAYWAGGHEQGQKTRPERRTLSRTLRFDRRKGDEDLVEDIIEGVRRIPQPDRSPGTISAAERTITLLWTCPSCLRPIHHDSEEIAPRPGVTYRCQVCRLDLIADTKQQKLMAGVPERGRDHQP